MFFVKLVLCYHGQFFQGLQLQPEGRTVAGELSNALRTLYRKPISFVASGRTDAGVHAEGQVISYRVSQWIPLTGLMKGLNALLPKEIRILEASKVDERFHAIKSAKSREYRYLFSEQTVPLCYDDFVVQLPFKPDLSRFEECKRTVVGQRDFVHFRSVGSKDTGTVRTVYQLELRKRKIDLLYTNGTFEFYELKIVGNGFLYRMVRNLMGALFEIWRGKQSVGDFCAMIEIPRKMYHYTTAPAKGLCLTEVLY